MGGEDKGKGAKLLEELNSLSIEVSELARIIDSTTSKLNEVVRMIDSNNNSKAKYIFTGSFTSPTSLGSSLEEI